ncbi:unnamed protein product [Brachionus calyciflorus]|uniref:N-acetylgalactosaminide beta-1,3-galactosyltransferase n=1 Tax=Brachionus calyciflorus TaxID=104777 RepID=A0A814EU62_9BILA|nr:unnamed protein product [Brachionus calyciflorus]
MIKKFFLLLIIISSLSTIVVIFQNTDKSNSINVKSSKLIFCLILTTPKSFKNGRVRTILNTWAYKCDGLKFITQHLTLNSTEKNSHFEYFTERDLLLYPPGLILDAYSKLTDKVYRTFLSVYSKYSNYSWYLKADDDTYIEMDNLNNFLMNKDPEMPVTFGHNFRIVVKDGYHSGGAGYVLSKKAFLSLGEKLNENFTFCPNSGVEDVDVAACLRKLNISMGMSVDEQGKGRFLPTSINNMVEGDVSWLKHYRENIPKKDTECCSDSFISFHNMSPEDMIFLDSVIKVLRKKSSRNNFKIKFKDIYANFRQYKNFEEEILKKL